MKREFEEISILQIVIGIFLYVVITAFLIWIFVIPTMKSYKSEYANYKTGLKSYYKILNRHENLKSRLENYRQTNKKILQAFRNAFNKEDFKNFSLKYFQNPKLSILRKESKDGFSVLVYKMDFVIKDIKSFYKFFDDLNSYSSIVKIDFPISLESLKPPSIRGSWFLKIYESNSSI